MLDVRVNHNAIAIGKFEVSFERTLRIPDDGNTYPLPPSLGSFPILNVDDYKDTVPKSWLEHGGVFIPLYQREAMWMCFHVRDNRSHAVKIAVGKINAVTGKPWSDKLEKDDYVVVPEQPWLDGINAGDDFIKQFVAMPLGMGYTVEGQVTGEEKFGGIQIICFDPKPGMAERQNRMSEVMTQGLDSSGLWASTDTTKFSCFAAKGLRADTLASSVLPKAAEMGLAAGGKMRQKIYPDKYGIDVWDKDTSGKVYVHIVNSMMYFEITGKESPPTPVSARSYTDAGLPWFDLYDEAEDDIKKSKVFDKVKSVKEMDKEKGFEGQQDDETVEVPDELVTKYHLNKDKVRNGKW